MAFYVDASDQREKARRAEQQLLEHTARRVPKQVPVPSEEDEITTLPPVFKRENGYEYTRETSLDKRAARFRDTHLYGPPPPPPVSPDAVPRVLPPKRFLVPQELANQGITNDPRYAVPSIPVEPVQPHAYAVPNGVPNSIVEAPQRILGYESEHTWPTGPYADSVPQHARRVPLPDAVVSTLLEATGQPLSPSQKKRLRKKRAKAARRGSAAPFPLAIDQPARSPGASGASVSAPPPVPDPAVTQTMCEARVAVVLPDGTVHQAVCPLKPFPHPNQPHMVELRPAPENEGTAVFLGWWHPGE